jgi:serine/threonine protein kinase
MYWCQELFSDFDLNRRRRLTVGQSLKRSSTFSPITTDGMDSPPLFLASSLSRPFMPLATAIRDVPSRAAILPGAGQTAQSSNLNTAASPVQLGPWQLEAIIADGRWNRVYRAVKAGGDKTAAGGSARYAIKALHEQHWSNPLSVSRLRTEATVGRCVMHAHLSPIVATHVHQAPYYTVMPLLAGASALAVLQTRGKFDVAFALWIARQIAEGLEALHTLGYVHGDVRLANIYIGTEGHATLLNLGSAQRVEADSSLDDQPLLGAIESLAPELHVGQAATPRSDLYSLGLAMFQMLTGRLPWRSTDAGVIAAWKTSGQAFDVREFAPGVPAAVSRFIRTMMAAEPLRRPHSAREVAEELVRLEIATLSQRLPM